MNFNIFFFFYFFFFFGGGEGIQIVNTFWGMEILSRFFGSSHNCSIFRVHFYAFKGLFLRSRNGGGGGGYFWGS